VRRIIRVALASIVLLAAGFAMAQQAAVRRACGTEIQQHCAGIRPGDGRIRACIEEHFPEFSEPCKQALLSNVVVVKACRTDVQRTCSGIEPGGGRIQACMKDHFAQYSEPCKRAIATAKFGNR
jgi:cysteine rich repeat protein